MSCLTAFTLFKKNSEGENVYTSHTLNRIRIIQALRKQKNTL